jgi:hypothetical protein
MLIAFSTACAVGESAVITLVFPYGARTNAMGEVGTALADDESAMFYNPAGLGFYNYRWQGGMVSWFYEKILPAFYRSIGNTDKWHSVPWTGIYRPHNVDIGGFGFYWNYLNFGRYPLFDDMGRELGEERTFEEVLSLSWGGTLGRGDNDHHAVGISAKYVLSAPLVGFGPGSEAAGRTFAIDVGYLYRTPIGIRVGTCFANMGPSIFYISRDEADPIPFTINLAAGYERLFTDGRFQIVRLKAEHRMEREFVKNYIEKRPDPFWKALYTSLEGKSGEEIWDEILQHIGVETTIFNTGAIRFGFLDDRDGNRRELHIGLGINLFNHFQFDYSNIFEPGRSEKVRTGQWGMSITLKRFAYWSKHDLEWWLLVPGIVQAAGF